MTQYQSLHDLFSTGAFDLCCVNAQGEVSVIRKGKHPDGSYIEIKTAQPDGYLKINIYHEDGTSEEFYEC